MKSLDTNIVVRALLRDDNVQTPIARALLRLPTFITVTVVLELLWVLTSRTSWSRAHIAGLLDGLMKAPNIQFGDGDAVRWSLDRFAAGADFADMLHLALSHGAEAFVTFDRGIARHTDPAGIPVETLG